MNRTISPRTLIEAFIPRGGEADLAQIYDTANELGISDQPIRLAIRRLVSAGEIEQKGRGRSGRIVPTSAGEQRLERDRIAVALAFAQDAGQAPWDGAWRLLSLSVSESKRTLRDAFRRDVLSLGAAPLSTSLYLSPHDIAEFLSPEATPYLVAASAKDVTVRGLTDPLEIAESLWPARSTIDGYSTLRDAIEYDDANLSPLARQIYLADALEISLRDDPLIPNELREELWEPARVRSLWLNLWREIEAESPSTPIYEGWLPE